MNERSMQDFFGKYIKINYPKETEAYELKYTKGTSIAFDMVKPHQVEALLKVEREGLYHRITDQPWIVDRPNVFTYKKPFDCFFIIKGKAFVVVWFYKERKPKNFIKIRINDFLKLKESTKRKSFTESMALEVATEVLNI